MPRRDDHSHADIKPVVYPPDFIFHVIINTAVERAVVELEGVPAVNPGFSDECSHFYGANNLRLSVLPDLPQIVSPAGIFLKGVEGLSFPVTGAKKIF